MSVYRVRFDNYEWSDKVCDNFHEAVRYAEQKKKDYNISSIIIEERTVWSSETLNDLLNNYDHLSKDELIAEIDRVFGTMNQGC